MILSCLPYDCAGQTSRASLPSVLVYQFHAALRTCAGTVLHYLRVMSTGVLMNMPAPMLVAVRVFAPHQ